MRLKTLFIAAWAAAILSLAFVSNSSADQRLDNTNGYCHFVVNPDNDDNETFLSGCDNSVTPVDGNAANGAVGSVTRVHFYQGFDEAPFEGGALKFKGVASDSVLPRHAEHLIVDTPCVMVDSNGTAYVTDNWESSYFKRTAVRYVYNTNPATGIKRVTNTLKGSEITFTINCRP